MKISGYSFDCAQENKDDDDRRKKRGEKKVKKNFFSLYDQSYILCGLSDQEGLQHP